MSPEWIHPLILSPDERASTLDARYAAANRVREAQAEARAVKAEALREAADAVFKDKGIQGLARVTLGNWLRARADQIEGATDE